MFVAMAAMNEKDAAAVAEAVEGSVRRWVFLLCVRRGAIGCVHYEWL